VRYLAAGGHGDVFDIDAHLQGMIALAADEHNTLAYALNERLDELVAADHVPYLSVRSEASSSLPEVVAELLGDGLKPPAPAAEETGDGEHPPSRSG
jgi:hypothetical protein